MLFHFILFVQITNFLCIISFRCLVEFSVEICLLVSHFFADFPDITLQLFYFVFYFFISIENSRMKLKNPNIISFFY